MQREKRYFAFISYSHKDEDWACWLQNELEGYCLPAHVQKEYYADCNPPKFRPVFRDVNELNAGNLSALINNALEDSVNLIVICSPSSAKSQWVNKEIQKFIEIGVKNGVDNVGKIYPFIVDGIPFCDDPNFECFPEALKVLSRENERIGGNIKEGVGKENIKGYADSESVGRERAFIKVLSGMLDLGFDVLWNRFERQKMAEEQKSRAIRHNLLLAYGQNVANVADKLLDLKDTKLAGLLCINAMPSEVDNPKDFPYSPQLEKVLRKVYKQKDFVIKLPNSHIVDFVDNNLLRVIDKKGRIWFCDLDDGRVMPFKDFYKINNQLFQDLKTNFDENVDYKYEMGLVNVINNPQSGLEIVIFSNKILVTKSTTFSSFTINVENTISDAALSHDGGLLTYSSGKEIIVYDTIKEEKVFELTCSDNVRKLSFSVNDDFILFSLYDMKIGKWSFYIDNLIQTQERSHCLNIFDNGERICGFLSSVYKTWNRENLTPYEDDVKIDGVYAIIGVNENHNKALINKKGEYCIYDVDNHRWELKCSYQGFAKASLSQDGSMVATFDKNAININYNDPEADDGIGVLISEVSPSGKWIALQDFDVIFHVLNIFDGDHKEFHLFEGKEPSYIIRDLAFNSDETKIVYLSRGNEVGIIDLADDQVIKREFHIGTHAKKVLFSPDDKFILVTTEDDLYVLNARNLRLIETLNDGEKTKSYFTSATFSPKGNFIIAKSEFSGIFIWECPSFKFIKKDFFIEDIVYSKDEQTCVLCRRTLIDRKKPNFVVSYEYHDTNIPDSHIDLETFGFFSSNEDAIIYYSGFSFVIYDLISKEKKIFIGHQNKINSVSVSKDGKRAISSSSDGTIRIWDIASASQVDCIQIFENGEHSFTYAKFVAEDSFIVYVRSTKDGDILQTIEYPSLQELIDQTRKHFRYREITEQERRIYNIPEINLKV